jgi:hypothetical protein
MRAGARLLEPLASEQEANMRYMISLRTAVSVCIFAAAAAPMSVFAGVMPVTDKAAISLQAQTNVVDWRPYSHRHHHWRPGWHWGRGPGMHYARWGRSAYWGYAGSPYCGYGAGAWGYNPAGGLLGAATDVAAAPLWAAGTAAGAVTDPFFGW